VNRETAVELLHREIHFEFRTAHGSIWSNLWGDRRSRQTGRTGHDPWNGSNMASNWVEGPQESLVAAILSALTEGVAE